MSRGLAHLIKASKVTQTAEIFLNQLIHTIECENRNTYKPTLSYKPSGIGGCLRGLYYVMTEEELDGKKTDYALSGICETGTDRHDQLQRYVMKMVEHNSEWTWVDVEEYLNEFKPEGTTVIAKKGNETKCYNSLYNMRFMCDGILYNTRLKKYFILEIKTESTYKYGNHTKPFDDHKQQAACYSLAFDISNVIFLYENRDNCTKKAMEVEVKDADIDEVICKIYECEEYLEIQEVPPKSEKVKDCTYCDYKKACKRDGG